MNSQSQLLKRLITLNKYLEIPSKGTSMFPIIRQNNICVFQKFDHEDVHRGDVLLFETKEGELTGHRFLHTIKSGNQVWYICKGDTNLHADKPVAEKQIIGRLKMIKRNGITLDADRRMMKIYSLLFSYSRTVPILCHLYVRKILKKRNEKANEESSSC